MRDDEHVVALDLSRWQLTESLLSWSNIHSQHFQLQQPKKLIPLDERRRLIVSMKYLEAQFLPEVPSQTDSSIQAIRSGSYENVMSCYRVRNLLLMPCDVSLKVNHTTYLSWVKKTRVKSRKDNWRVIRRRTDRREGRGCIFNPPCIA